MDGLYYLLNHYTHAGILYVTAVVYAVTSAAAILIYEATVMHLLNSPQLFTCQQVASYT